MSSQHVTIRAATLEDTGAIWSSYQTAIPETAKRNEEYWEKLIRAGGMFIAELPPLAIGFGGIDFDATEQIRYVYVIPEYQGSRLRAGSRILRALEAVARERGIALIRLHSTPNAVGFYEKAGYSIVPVNNIIGHDHAGVEMAKDLGSRAPDFTSNDQP